VPWGQFALGPVYRAQAGHDGMVQVGWWAKCWEHTNDGDVPGCSMKCQKQLTTLSGDRAVSLDEVKRLLKIWLLLGRAIPPDDPQGRNLHVRGLGGSEFRATAPAWTHEQCDAMLANGAAAPS